VAGYGAVTGGEERGGANDLKLSALARASAQFPPLISSSRLLIYKNSSIAVIAIATAI